MNQNEGKLIFSLVQEWESRALKGITLLQNRKSEKVGVAHYDKEKGGMETELPLTYLGKEVGTLCLRADFQLDPTSLAVEGMSGAMAPLVVGDNEEAWKRQVHLLQWVQKMREIAPDLCHWTGLYFRADFYLKEEGPHQDDLVLGPFLGEPTPHMRIPQGQGLCGLAVREERVVNIGDVREDSRYLSCSFKTKAELVIPLRNRDGIVVGELDIDSHQPHAFSKELEGIFLNECGKFPQLFEEWT